MPPVPLSPSASRSDPAAILRRNRERATSFATKAGQGPVRALLERAQRDLLARIVKAEGLRGPGKDSFTAAQLRITLEQIRDVLGPLQGGMKSAIVQQGTAAAQSETEQIVGYLQDGERKFRGVAQGLQINEAAIMTKAVSGTESSILSRIETNPADPRRRGVLDRYGASVIDDFEQELSMRFLAKQPWEDVKKAITEKSAFLQGAPAFWAERIVRTEVMNANNRAGLETIKAADSQLGDMCKILCATFDNRTGADSYAVHGQIRRPSESFDSWFGAYAHPPNRPNDREVVVPHRVSWPIPPELQPKSSGEISAAWTRNGRKGSPPAQPKISTIDLALFGKQDPPPVKPPEGSPEPSPTERQPQPPGQEGGENAPDTERQAPPGPPKKKRAGRRLASGFDELDLPLPPGVEAPSGWEEAAYATGGRVPVFPGARTGMQTLGIDTLYQATAKGEEVVFEPGALGKLKKAPKSGALRPYADVLKALGKDIERLVADHAEDLPVNDSALKEVKATKRSVDRRVVASLIARPVPLEDAAPVYVKHEGKFYLHAGHEQLMAANLGTAPKTSRPSKLIDLDKLKRPPAREPKAIAAKLVDALPINPTGMSLVAQREVRAELRGMLASKGIVSREDRYRQSPVLGQLPDARVQGLDADVYRAAKEPSWVSGALGTHDWHGAIEMAPDAHISALSALRAIADGRSLGDTVEINSVGSGLRTLVHEQIHGASKARPTAYQGIGVGMEEAATEILARKVTRELFGHTQPTGESFALPTRGSDGRYAGGSGSYPGYINGLFDAVGAATGHEGIHGRIEQALVKTREWGKGDRYDTPTQAIADFVHHVTDKPDERRALFVALHDPHRTPFQ